MLSVRLEKEAFANRSGNDAKCTIVTEQTLMKLNKTTHAFII